MNQIIDRFYRLLRSAHVETEQTDYDDNSYFSQAWEELNNFLKEENNSPSVPEILRQDYETLDIHFGAPFSVVKTRYIHLVKKYHPDQFARAPQRQSAANEKIKAVNISFQRIRAWEKAKTGK